MRTTSLALVPLLALLACTSHVDIGPDNSAAVSAGSGHGHHGTQGGVGGGTVATTTVGSAVTTAVSTGAGGSSCCSTTQRTVSAENDAVQLVSVRGGPPPGTPSAKLIDGPFVLTDAQGVSGGSLWLVDTGDCSAPATSSSWFVVGLNSSMSYSVHGARVVVPAGSALCSDIVVAFSGFRPY